jgi:hypothetical protein
MLLSTVRKKDNCITTDRRVLRRRPRPGIQRLTILDWDVVQIDGALLKVDAVGIGKARQLSAPVRCHQRQPGVFIEDASMGSILLQKGPGMAGQQN